LGNGGSKLRVLVIAQLFPPDMGGGATRAYNVVRGLVLNGCRVTVVTAFPHYPSGDIPREYRWRPLRVEWFGGFKVVRTFVPPLASKGLVRRLVLFLSFMVSSLFAVPFVGGVDVVWAANPNILAFMPALVYGFVKRCPVVLNVDDLWPEDLYSFGMLKEGSLFSRIAEFLARFAYRRAWAITPISPGYVGVISGKYRVDASKICVVRAGVDVDRFRLNSGGRNGGKFRVLYSGAFSVAYDFDQVLLAAKNLEESEEIEFILQGGGELADYLKAKVEELRLKNVKVINRIVSRDEVAKLLSGTDALILPLRDFGTPYLGISSKLYEYQAAGKPIICCAEGESARYVEETKSGIVVKPGDHEALAKAVLYLRENRELAEELGRNGRRYVEDKLSIEKIGLQMMEIFRALLMRGRTVPPISHRCLESVP